MSASEELVLFRRAPAGLPRRELREFADSLCGLVTRRREFHCLITDDRELRRLNRQFRGADYATDVLSFPANDGGGWLGEIAISAERAAEQAREFGHSRVEEIRVLMLHGVLHLLGMDHEKDRGQMARVEAKWRRKLGLSTGLIDRAS